MRKSNMRKWFHLIIDFIPLFIIPIFAININEKNVESISIDVQENKFIDFNQNIHNGDFEENTWWTTYSQNSASLNIEDTTATVTFLTNNEGSYRYALRQNISHTVNHKILVSFDMLVSFTTKCTVEINGGNKQTFYSLVQGEYTRVQFIKSISNAINQTFLIYPFVDNYNLNVIGNTFSVQNVNTFDLTQMFGEGNEPTVQEFNNYFPNSYYPYIENEEQVIENYTTITYNNTDIGSQFVYSLYKPVHDYFNISELGGFKQFYQWIEMNMFNGAAPLPFFIVFNIMMYNFIVDLIFLLYSVFMFFIDFTEKCLDRFYGRSNT